MGSPKTGVWVKKQKKEKMFKRKDESWGRPTVRMPSCWAPRSYMQLLTGRLGKCCKVNTLNLP